MKALSIKQPYAQLIVENIKPIENRSFKTNYRGLVYIHASGQWHDRLKTKELFTNEQWLNIHSKSLQLEQQKNIFRFLEKEVKTDKLITSAIIGEVEIIDCVINHPSIWAEETDENEIGWSQKPIYNWVLANPVLYDKPILNVKGKLSFWEPNIDIVECIGCSQKFNSEEMEEDDACEKYCHECWQELSPIMQQEYLDLKAKGEID